MTCDDRLDALRDYLKKNGLLSDVEIAEACSIASESMGEDNPPPFPGRPNPGGHLDSLGATDSRLIFKQNGVMDSRNVALAFASRIQRDNSVPTEFYPPSTQSTKARKQLAQDASAAHSSSALNDFHKRFPGAAKIGRA
jgi:hypothetical protein